MDELTKRRRMAWIAAVRRKDFTFNNLPEYSRVCSRHFHKAWRQHHGPQMDELTKRRRMAWISAVGRKELTFSKLSKYSRVCSKHFHKGKPAMEMSEFDPDWAPSLHLGHTQVKASSIDNLGRLDRRKRRNKIQQAAVLSNTGPATAPDVEVYVKEEVVVKEEVDDEAALGQQVDAAPLPCVVAPFCAEINRLLEENRTLKEKLANQVQSIKTEDSEEMVTEHHDDSATLELQFFPCDKCEASFTDNQELKEHDRDVHRCVKGRRREQKATVH